MSTGRILVIEDDIDNYQLVRFILEQYGYETFLAVSGLDGVDAARIQSPDLILLDLALPEMDGWEVAQRLKSEPQTASIPVVALTARTLPEDRQRALDAGCTDFIPKPIDMGTLLRIVEMQLKFARERENS
ncbi:MAG: response regulator [Anaerolineae bacterium]